jgi:hypothetical protein
MGTELPTKVMLGQTLVLMQMTFLNNVRKVGRLVLSRTYDISKRPKLVIAISGLINITNFATYQYKTTFDIISLKVCKEMTN